MKLHGIYVGMITIDEQDGPWITLHVMSDHKKTKQKEVSKAQRQKLKQEREARLAAALRENLLKRKAQMRARLNLDAEEGENALEDSRKIA